jgi:hypothetical protein
LKPGSRNFEISKRFVFTEEERASWEKIRQNIREQYSKLNPLLKPIKKQFGEAAMDDNVSLEEFANLVSNDEFYVLDSPGLGMDDEIEPRRYLRETFFKQDDTEVQVDPTFGPLYNEALFKIRLERPKVKKPRACAICVWRSGLAPPFDPLVLSSLSLLFSFYSFLLCFFFFFPFFQPEHGRLDSIHIFLRVNCSTF